MNSERILVAMSGGVDSSVAACLLRERGVAIEGGYMKNWINEDNILGDCPWQQDIEDARAVAQSQGIPFTVVNLMRDYRKKIVDYLLREYSHGLTPNPDVLCNREIKFGVFLKWAIDHGFTKVATGHYAQKRENADGTFDLLEGRDKNKDQSYFLALMKQEQIARAEFPIGHLTKPQVREQAARFQLPVAHKKDSQGICFIGQIKMRDFLAAYVPEKPGNIVDIQGKRLGEHRGLHFYTLGQRKGIRVASPVQKEAYVVVEKRIERNELVVGFDAIETPGLYVRAAAIASLSFTNRPIVETCEILARPRYRAPAVPATFEPSGNGGAIIHFHEPQRAIAAGQICAWYDGERLLGGGVFAGVIS